MGRYPLAEILLLHVLHIISLYPTRQHAYRILVLPVMIYFAVKVYLTPEVTDPLKLTYVVGCAIAGNFIFRANLLFSGGSFPDHWRRVRDEIGAEVDAGVLDKLPSNFPFTKKLWWMVDIAYSSRMIGWVQEPQGCIPPHPPPSRRTFLWKTLFKFIVNVVTRDLMTSALALSPAFDHRVHDPGDGPEAYLTAIPFLRRVPYILAWSIEAAASVGIVYNAFALICVGLGNSSPTLWPDSWGRWGDAYTVRRLWGYVR